MLFCCHGDAWSVHITKWPTTVFQTLKQRKYTKIVTEILFLGILKGKENEENDTLDFGYDQNNRLRFRHQKQSSYMYRLTC